MREVLANLMKLRRIYFCEAATSSNSLNNHHEMVKQWWPKIHQGKVNDRSISKVFNKFWQSLIETLSLKFKAGIRHRSQHLPHSKTQDLSRAALCTNIIRMLGINTLTIHRLFSNSIEPLRRISTALGITRISRHSNLRDLHSHKKVNKKRDKQGRVAAVNATGS